jgi:hypothetical protein
MLRKYARILRTKANGEGSGSLYTTRNHVSSRSLDSRYQKFEYHCLKVWLAIDVGPIVLSCRGVSNAAPLRICMKGVVSRPFLVGLLKSCLTSVWHQSKENPTHLHDCVAAANGTT